MKKLHLLLFLLGLGFLACLLWKIGIRTLGDELMLLGWGLAPFIMLEFVAEGIHTLGWRSCLSGPHRRMPYLQLFHIRMAGYAINYLTPTAALGGETTKAAFLSCHHQGPAAVSGVLADKLCAGIGQLLFVIAGSVFVIGNAALPRAVWGALFLSTGLVAGGMLVFLLLQKNGKLGALIRWLAACRFSGGLLEKAARQVNEVDEKLKVIYRRRPRMLVLAVGWHLLGNFIGILQTWWFFGFLHEPVSWAPIAGVWVLGLWFDLLTFAVPLNLGTLEGSRIIAFRAMGLGAVLGMTFGIAQRLAQLACATFGLITYGWLVRQVDRSMPVRQTRVMVESALIPPPAGIIKLENEP